MYLPSQSQPLEEERTFCLEWLPLWRPLVFVGVMKKPCDF